MRRRRRQRCTADRNNRTALVRAPACAPIPAAPSCQLAVLSGSTRARVSPSESLATSRSSARISPGWTGGMAAVVIVPPSLVVDDLNVLGTGVGPGEADAPLVVDTDAGCAEIGGNDALASLSLRTPARAWCASSPAARSCALSRARCTAWSRSLRESRNVTCGEVPSSPVNDGRPPRHMTGRTYFLTCHEYSGGWGEWPKTMHRSHGVGSRPRSAATASRDLRSILKR